MNVTARTDNGGGASAIMLAHHSSTYYGKYQRQKTGLEVCCVALALLACAAALLTFPAGHASIIVFVRRPPRRLGKPSDS